MHVSEILFHRITSDDSRIFYRGEYYCGACQPVPGWNGDLRDPIRRRRSVQSDRHPALDYLQTGAHRRRPSALTLRNHNRQTIRLHVRHRQIQTALLRTLPRQNGF